MEILRSTGHVGPQANDAIGFNSQGGVGLVFRVSRMVSSLARGNSADLLAAKGLHNRSVLLVGFFCMLHYRYHQEPYKTMFCIVRFAFFPGLWLRVLAQVHANTGGQATHWPYAAGR